MKMDSGEGLEGAQPRPAGAICFCAANYKRCPKIQTVRWFDGRKGVDFFGRHEKVVLRDEDKR